MRTEKEIVEAIAQDLAKRIVKKTIVALQRMTDCTLSGDDSGLKNVWDELCAQVQCDSSIFWECYDDTVKALVAGFIDPLKDYEKLALWCQTEAGWDWLYDQKHEEEPDQGKPPIDVDEILEYLVQEHLYPEAGQWSNARIEKFLDRQSFA